MGGTTVLGPPQVIPVPSNLAQPVAGGGTLIALNPLNHAPLLVHTFAIGENPAAVTWRKKTTC